MELMTLDDVVLAPETRSLLRDVDDLAVQVNHFRPLSPELVKTVHDQLFPDRIYSSNAIEGNTLTLRETIQILTTGHVSDRRKREGTEAKNLGAAVRFMEAELLQLSNPFLVDHLLRLHKILLTDLDATAGSLRTERVMIGGATEQPPRQDLIPMLMDQVMEKLRSAESSRKPHPIVIATWAHWAIARVHPFMDGNGRTARLWQDLILLRARLGPAIIRLQDRDQNGYYDSLAQADKGDFNPLVQLIAQRAAATLDKYVSAQQQTAELDQWASTILNEVGTRMTEKRRAEYLRWSRLMESLKHDFQRCAAKMTAGGQEVQFREFPMIDEVAWNNLRNGLGSKKAWFFSLSFRRESIRCRYFFFFGKHFWKPLDEPDDQREPKVALLVSEQMSDEDAELLYDQSETPLDLREVFTTGTELIRVRASGARSDPKGLEYDRGISGLTIAQDFIAQVVLRRLT